MAQQKTMSPIIFLDCDGVLNNHNSISVVGDNFLPYVVESNLVKILRIFCEQRNALIVLSSSWRITITKDELISIIGDWLRFHLILGDGWRTGRDPRGFRGNEVDQWFIDYPQDKGYKYIIFDDDSDFHPHQPLVKVDGSVGLISIDIQKARKFL